MATSPQQHTPKTGSSRTKAQIISAAIHLIRKKGFIATSVDDICSGAEVSKGAFFHHFKSKEELAEACLMEWNRIAGEIAAGGPHHQIQDPRERLLAFLGFFRSMLEDPKVVKSCPAGTMVQEVSETHPQLRAAANTCFVDFGTLLKGLLDAAVPEERRGQIDTSALAELWMATMQGSLILYKASQDVGVISRSLHNIESYIAGVLAGDHRSPAGRISTPVAFDA